MKTVTAKEFQLNQSKVMKEVAAGKTYQVTFHGKPMVKLVPAAPEKATIQRGGHAAFLRSLQYTVTSQGPVHDLPYKELRARMMAEKYGDANPTK